jgi:hypothetical protein
MSWINICKRFLEMERFSLTALDPMKTQAPVWREDFWSGAGATFMRWQVALMPGRTLAFPLNLRRPESSP